MQDTRFFTNENNETLAKRLEAIIGKETERFDSLTGYFYITGYKLLSNALQNTKKIRILIGINSNQETIDHILASQKVLTNKELDLNFNSHQLYEEYSKKIIEEFYKLEDSLTSYQSTHKFITDLISKNLEVRVHPDKKLHSKLYIMHYKKDAIDNGRVITGSSNFSVAGLTNNLELNVELKDNGDYNFANEYFEKLWADAVNVKDIIIQTVEQKTWFNKTITPYELFLKFLYEHFKEDLSINYDVNSKFLPNNFIELKYQKQAVSKAKRILKEYNGVFISDVVGLGKTYMGALLAQQIQMDTSFPSGHILVVAPPHLIDENNAGSWTRVFRDFAIPQVRFISIGSLEDIKEPELSKFKFVFVDESHRFRNDRSKQWAQLKTICHNKKVILVSATPYNNKPQDILSQISLFQSPVASDIPNKPNLEKFFKEQDDRIKKINRKTNPIEYIATAKNVAKIIRQDVLRYLMIRRTRQEIETYFKQDMEYQGLSFPNVHRPNPVYYKLNNEENNLFHETLGVLKQFNYARYIPKLYLHDEYKSGDNVEELSQQNLRKILKGLLLKRMDSSIPAFITMLENMQKSTEYFANSLKDGKVYFTDKSQKFYDALDNAFNGDEEELNKMEKNEELDVHPAEYYKDSLKTDIEEDLQDLKYLLKKWNHIFEKRDIKKDTLISTVKNDKKLSNKFIIFTESVVTANYLSEKLLEAGKSPLCGVGNSGKSIRAKIIDNFTPVSKGNTLYNDYNVLIVTDAYSEGINLHSTNVIINYDIPWNPTRMMQRAGRVNRVGTLYSDIYSYNFFPSEEVDEQIALQSKAEAKIEAFFELLGEDAGVLTEGENPEPKGLFDTNIEDEEDNIENSDLKYLQIIRDVKDNSPELFEKIKHMAIKSRSSCFTDTLPSDAVLSYIRKGELKKYFMTCAEKTDELDFMTTAKYMECKPDKKTYKIDDENMILLYDGLEKNMQALNSQIQTETVNIKQLSGQNPKQVSSWLQQYIRDSRTTTNDKEYFKDVLNSLKIGIIPHRYVNDIAKQIKNWGKQQHTPSAFEFKILLENNIHNNLLHNQSKKTNNANKKIIVTLFMKSQ